MTVSEEEVQERVTRGVDLLDEKFPKWLDAIDTSELAMESVRSCVLGQVCGGYDVGLMELELTDDDCWEYGFSLTREEMRENWSSGGSRSNWLLLRDAWADVVQSRQEATDA